jgi:Inward rectifier potassium channel transmembrane domain
MLLRLLDASNLERDSHVFRLLVAGWTILVFSLNFILSWLFLGIIWYLIAYAHGDIDYFDDLMKSGMTEDAFAAYRNHTPCVTEVKSFLSAFLFSLETQHTIGERLGVALMSHDYRFANDTKSCARWTHKTVEASISIRFSFKAMAIVT